MKLGEDQIQPGLGDESNSCLDHSLIRRSLNGAKFPIGLVVTFQQMRCKISYKIVKFVEGGWGAEFRTSIRYSFGCTEMKTMKNFSPDNRFLYRDSTRALRHEDKTQYSWSNLLYSVV
jgi:hypothetical protein